MDVEIRPLTEGEAWVLVGWRYDPPYDVYTIGPATPETVRRLLLPEHAYYAILHQGDQIGFCCYGQEAQVPGGDYHADALDVGLGLRPDLTGQGLGGQILPAVLDIGRHALGARQFRVTIAAWNRRSIRTFEQLGFQATGTFRTEGNPAGDAWVQLMRAA